ncbi:SAGA-associated factor 29 isoform X2 [Phyllopteryx taeniolatus]|uniref:SAGA-associated factor 29 isoform X2 n=1 Tax=Phyllopteryx taeniolatus TaxID=161469 RepID=UPI002AD3238F|nr:SAGA-associated factor 29 isoform X2 [Phyllopteryx taeniolatus]
MQFPNLEMDLVAMERHPPALFGSSFVFSAANTLTRFWNVGGAGDQIAAQRVKTACEANAAALRVGVQQMALFPPRTLQFRTSDSRKQETTKKSRLRKMSADTKIAELLTELHQLIKHTQEERSRSEHNLLNIHKTHERMQTENKTSPYYRTKLRGLYITAKADAEAECGILRRALDKIAEIKSLLEERRIAAKMAGVYSDSDPPRKTMRRGVLMTLLQQSAMTLPLWIGKPGERYEVDDIDEEGKERHTLSRRRIIPLPQWKANPETDPEALFGKDQLVLALYPQTTCFYRALIHAPPHRPQDDYSVLFEDTSYADGYSPPLNVAQRYVVACKENKKK